jgi:hypothetical protein
MASTDERARPALCGVVVAQPRTGSLARAAASLAWAEERVILCRSGDAEALAVAAELGLPAIEAHEPERALEALRERVGAPWVLVLEADEVVSADAERAAAQLLRTDADAFALPRYTRIGEQPLRGAPGYPDPRVRLYRPAAVEGAVTEAVPTAGAKRLHRPEAPCLHLHHAGYPDLARWLDERVARTEVRPADGAWRAGVAAAVERAARRDLPDGDLGRALALLDAWTQVRAGLLAWEARTPRPSLPDDLPAPCVREAPAPGLLDRLLRRRRPPR